MSGSFFLHFAYFFLPTGFFLSPGLGTGLSVRGAPFLSASLVLGLEGMLLVVSLVGLFELCARTHVIIVIALIQSL